MKRHFLSASLLTATLLTAANVQAQQLQTHCVVPFAFHIGEKTLPAGDYLAVQHNSYKTIQNRSTGQQAIASVGNPSVPGKPGARMVFNKYGDTYFLEEVWTDQQAGSRVPQSQEEQTLRREFVSSRLRAASASPKPEQSTVTVIAER